MSPLRKIVWSTEVKLSLRSPSLNILSTEKKLYAILNNSKPLFYFISPPPFFLSFILLAGIIIKGRSSALHFRSLQNAIFFYTTFSEIQYNEGTMVVFNRQLLSLFQVHIFKRRCVCVISPKGKLFIYEELH